MSEQRQFVGRKKELDEFQQFLAGERDGPGGKGAPMLLVVGDRGMGKTALLQSMAQEAAVQKHFAIVGEVDKRQTEFSEQIYPLIAMLQGEKRLKLGAGRFWLKASLVALGTKGMLYGAAAKLGSLLIDIRTAHKNAGSTPVTLAELFHSAIIKTSDKLKGNQKIVILLDPEKESPPGLIPLLRKLERLEMPDKVRFVIAQRHKDALIKAVDEGEIHRLCVEPMILDKMDLKEGQAFIETFDPDIRLKGAAQEVFWKRYGGWPLLMELALEQIEKADAEINEQFIKSLPADIAGFWQQRFQDIRETESQIFVQTVCLLPHPYPKDRLAKFMGLDPDQMHKAWNDKLVWCMLEKHDYEETVTEQSWSNCPAPRHVTAREYVLERLEEDEILEQKRLSTIVSHYKDQIGEDLESADVDKDALVFLPVCLVESKDWDSFVSEVYRLTQIKRRYGLLESLITDLKLALKISEVSENKKNIAYLTGNLGLVYRIHGDLLEAEAMYKKSLEIYEALGHKEGMAAVYVNLGSVYQFRGDLDDAEAMYKKSLEIDEEMGNKEGMDTVYGNLGSFYQFRGDLDDAEAMYKKSLEIDEEMGNKEGMAAVYGNLGSVYRIRGDLDDAEAMYKKSLEIYEALGHKEGMANQYGRLGRAYRTRGDLDGAEAMYKKRLEIEEVLGRKEGMAEVYGNLGSVYGTRGDLDDAEAMYKKSLAIEEELGHKAGMASDYGNLGSVYQIHGDLDDAEAMYKKSLEIYEALGHKEGMANQYWVLGIVYRTRGDLDDAEAMWEKSLELYEAIGAKLDIEQIKGLLEDLREQKE